MKNHHSAQLIMPLTNEWIINRQQPALVLRLFDLVYCSINSPPPPPRWQIWWVERDVLKWPIPISLQQVCLVLLPELCGAALQTLLHAYTLMLHQLLHLTQLTLQLTEPLLALLLQSGAPRSKGHTVSQICISHSPSTVDYIHLKQFIFCIKNINCGFANLFLLLNILRRFYQ